jgi:hypothetical protein
VVWQELLPFFVALHANDTELAAIADREGYIPFWYCGTPEKPLPAAACSRCCTLLLSASLPAHLAQDAYQPCNQQVE